MIYFFAGVLFLEENIFSSLGISFSIYILLVFIDKIGKEYPLKELILLIMCLQWIVGAKISYLVGPIHYKYYMYVNEAVYMGYVVPSVIIFAIGLYLFKVDLNLGNIKSKLLSDFPYQKQIAFLLIIVGFIGKFLELFFSFGGIAFIIYLSGLLFYVGIGYLLLLFPKDKWKVFVFSILTLLAFALRKAMFHDFILTATFLLFFVIPERFSFYKKVALILGGFLFLNSLQLIKSDFRKELSRGGGKNSIELFTSLLFNVFDGDQNSTGNRGVYNSFSRNSVTEDESVSKSNNRLNQGWIISKIMDNVPRNKPFLNGETVVESIQSSILPRFLFPNKAGATKSLENFKNVTGILLNDNTSMGMSIVGEFYANYGRQGGWLAIFIYGLFLSVVIKYIVVSISNGSQLIIIWFLFFFFQVIKAEIDLIKILNHLFKSLIFFLLFKQVLFFLNVQLFPNRDVKLERLDVG